MVRLKDKMENDGGDMVFDFNSNMVRLKVNRLPSFMFLLPNFNSNMVRLKEWSWDQRIKYVEHFNSNMVRLKEIFLSCAALDV